MKANIKDNKFITMGQKGIYEILNPDELTFNMNCIFIVDINNNHKFIPEIIDDTNCNIKINTNYEYPVLTN